MARGRARTSLRTLVVAAAVAAGAAAAAPGCIDMASAARSPTPPLRVRAHAPLGPEQARGVVVFLPGFGAPVTRFETHGYVELACRRGYDVLLPDLHFGYYRRTSLVPRLAEDVIGRARQLGYREVWLVGASMGGLGALVYAEAHPDDLDGVILIAPFITPPTVEEVRAAGGIGPWEPKAGSTDGNGPLSLTRRGLDWLEEQGGEGVPPVYLIYTRSDPNADVHRMVAEVLPEPRVVVGPGGHKWEAWRPLLERVLERVLQP